MITSFCIELLPIYSTIYHPSHCGSVELTALLVFLNENVRHGLVERVKVILSKHMSGAKARAEM